MIEYLDIRNFQRHRKVRIKFAPDVTFIVGDNDIGKSTIIRALRFLLLNSHPRNFMSWGEKNCRLKAGIDGHVIERYTGSKGNYYKVNGKRLNFDITRSMPEELVNLFNVNQANFQEQHEAHFWFSLSPGKVSKELNKIIDLDIIDTTLANIASSIKYSRTEEKVVSQQIKETKSQLDQLSWVPKAEAVMKKVVHIEKRWLRYKDKAAHLKDLLGKLTEAHSSLDKAKVVAAKGQEILVLGQRALAKAKEASDLKELLVQIEAVTNGLNTPLPTISPELEQTVVKGIKAEGEMIELSHIITQIHLKEVELCEVKKSLTKYEKRLHKYTKGRCPICQREM